jgi:hypothetical protein
MKVLVYVNDKVNSENSFSEGYGSQLEALESLSGIYGDELIEEVLIPLINNARAEISIPSYGQVSIQMIAASPRLEIRP